VRVTLNYEKDRPKVLFDNKMRL